MSGADKDLIAAKTSPGPGMQYALKDSVVREIDRAFAAEDVSYVRRRLEETRFPMDRMAPPPRVQIAVIWLSEGDVHRFEQALDGACIDWRDTLVAAGLQHEDWKEVLRARGIDGEDW